MVVKVNAKVNVFVNVKVICLQNQGGGRRGKDGRRAKYKKAPAFKHSESGEITNGS